MAYSQAVRGETPASIETGDAPGSQGATSEHIGPYVSEEQRSEFLAGPPTRVSQRVGVQEGCSAGRMPAEFHRGLLSTNLFNLLARRPLAEPHLAAGWSTRLSCSLWGHHVDNHVFRRARGLDRSCRCGTPYLSADGSCTRVRHTLSCFLGHHTYVRVTDRDGHHEYTCVQCGHPLLFTAGHDPYAAAARFEKKVRYLCGLFGHRVHQVTERHGFIEYACHCGHTFLKPQDSLEVVRHPLVCVSRGHYVRYVTSRAGYAEFVCRDCGHPFCFAEPQCV